MKTQNDDGGRDPAGHFLSDERRKKLRCQGLSDEAIDLAARLAQELAVASGMDALHCFGRIVGAQRVAMATLPGPSRKERMAKDAGHYGRMLQATFQSVATGALQFAIAGETQEVTVRARNEDEGDLGAALVLRVAGWFSFFGGMPPDWLIVKRDEPEAAPRILTPGRRDN